MKAGEAKLFEFLQGPKQFVIPIYQRTYSWTMRQCQQLWDDILRVADDPKAPGHFIGSIVYIHEGIYVATSVSELLVIDGQQRLITLSLLLSALAKAIEKSDAKSMISRKIKEYYLFNALEEGDLNYKLIPTKSDKETYTLLIDGNELPPSPSKRLIDNYQFFEKKINETGMDLIKLYEGIGKLLIVEVSLNRDNDNPQLIFESLNSTGLDLSQADLIRNYILMGLEPKKQGELYKDYWFPMEQSFDHSERSPQFDRFIRDYLTICTR